LTVKIVPILTDNKVGEKDILNRFKDISQLDDDDIVLSECKKRSASSSSAASKKPKGDTGREIVRYMI
jgi:hypothetical protein